jgi:RNA polymerase sigma factor (TIGR02999 family)
LTSGHDREGPSTTSGDTDEMLARVYDELRRLAAARLAREGPGGTLQPTALVHEAYLRLVGDEVRWDGRGHFFGAAAQAMRRILVERARHRGAARHGGGQVRVDIAPDQLDAPDLIPTASSDQILAVDRLLDRMEERDPRMAEVVKLRFFAGLSVDQTAAAMCVSDRTVRREWTFAKAWLSIELGGDPEWTSDGSE